MAEEFLLRYVADIERDTTEKWADYLSGRYVKRLEALENQSRAWTNATPAANASEIAASTPAMPPPSWSPANPIRIASAGQNYINLSFDGLFAAGSSTASDVESLERGGHDPKQRGFTVQNLETVFDGKVDPYFRGQANIVFQIKMLAMVLAGSNLLFFHCTSYFRVCARLVTGDEAPALAKFVAASSIFLWIALIILGRYMPFFEVAN